MDEVRLVRTDEEALIDLNSVEEMMGFKNGAMNTSTGELLDHRSPAWPAMYGEMSVHGISTRKNSLQSTLSLVRLMQLSSRSRGYVWINTQVQ